MATIKTFRALAPVPEKARAVSSVPYDVVTVEEAKNMAEGNPLSFLHVIRPEIDLPEGMNPYDPAVYEKAAQNFHTLRQKNLLIQDDSPALYIYRLQVNGHEQTGVAGCCWVDEYDRNIIKKHEHTRKEKEDDRVRHMLALSAHAGPVLMTYRGIWRLDVLIDRERKNASLYDFTAVDGVRHTVWRAENSEEIAAAFKEVPYLYIADGHHRAAGASRVREEMRKKNIGRGDDSSAEYNFFLAVLFPSEQLRILSYNRYVSDLNGQSEKDFMKEVKARFDVAETTNPAPPQKGVFCMYLGGTWYRLTAARDVNSNDPVSALDLSIFQRLLLEPILGIMDQKKNRRIDFVGGPDSTEKLKRSVDIKGGVAFSFYPVGVEELLAVADAGMVMPPKSTWFSPKLRSGLLVHLF